MFDKNVTKQSHKKDKKYNAIDKTAVKYYES